MLNRVSATASHMARNTASPVWLRRAGASISKRSRFRMPLSRLQRLIFVQGYLRQVDSEVPRHSQSLRTRIVAGPRAGYIRLLEIRALDLVLARSLAPCEIIERKCMIQKYSSTTIAAIVVSNHRIDKLRVLISHIVCCKSVISEKRTCNR